MMAKPRRDTPNNLQKTNVNQIHYRWLRKAIWPKKAWKSNSPTPSSVNTIIYAWGLHELEIRHLIVLENLANITRNTADNNLKATSPSVVNCSKRKLTEQIYSLKRKAEQENINLFDIVSRLSDPVSMGEPGEEARFVIPSVSPGSASSAGNTRGESFQGSKSDGLASGKFLTHAMQLRSNSKPES